MVFKLTADGHIGDMWMKKRIANLLKNELFLILMNGVIGYTAMTAVIIATLNVPPEAILDTNLKEILYIFEGWDVIAYWVSCIAAWT